MRFGLLAAALTIVLASIAGAQSGQPSPPIASLSVRRHAVAAADSAARALQRFAGSEDAQDLAESIRLAGASDALFGLLSGTLPKDLADLRRSMQRLAKSLGPHFIVALSENGGVLGEEQVGLATAASILSVDAREAVKKYGGA